MMTKLHAIVLSTTLSALSLLAGCTARSQASGNFERTYTVNGPVRLELTNGSGSSTVTVGNIGQVRVHAEFHVRSWSAESSQRRLQELVANPPVSQEGNLIRIGGVGPKLHDISVDYTIVAPKETEVRGASGSGDIHVDGVSGPANFSVGSGEVIASNISGDVQAAAGSGELRFSNIQGQVQTTTGSGDANLSGIRGQMFIQSGSGAIQIANPSDALTVNTGSGKVRVIGATADLRVRTGSGDIFIDGNPGATNFWDVHTSSGNVTLQVPTSANFRFYAHSNSGAIDAAVPITMEGTAGKHELRARLGEGKARVEVATSSGGISLR